MNKKLLLTSAIAAAMLTASAYAAEKSSGLFLESMTEADFASGLIGTTVYDRSGDDAQSIGKINDLIVKENGKIAAAVIGVGGFLGVGEKDVAVSFDAFELTTDADGDRYLILETTKQDLETAPDFEYDTAMAPAGEEVAPKEVSPKADRAMSEPPADEEAADTTPGDQAATEPRSSAPDREGLRAAEAGTFSADNLIGVAVYDADNETIGEVSDVILAKEGSDGAIDAVILDVGGFLGIGEKPVAVSFDSLEIMADENNDLFAYSKFTQEQLEGAAEYDADTYEANRETMLVRPQG